MRMIFIFLFVFLFSFYVKGSDRFKAEKYVISCIDDITVLNATKDINKIDRVIVKLMRNDYASTTFASGTKGRADFYDPEYKSLYSCIYKNNELLYLDYLFTNILVDKLVGSSHEELNVLGAVSFNFQYSLKNELKLVKSHIIPNTTEEMLKQMELHEEEFNTD